MMKRGWEKLCLKLKNRMICNQLQIIRFFSSSMMEITKITAVYGAALSVSLDEILA